MQADRLETFQGENLCYSTLHCDSIELYLPLPDIVDGLFAISGRQAITKMMEHYFRGPNGHNGGFPSLQEIVSLPSIP